MTRATRPGWNRRRTARTAIGLALVGIALYAAGSLGAAISSGQRADLAEYQYPTFDMNASPNPARVGQPVTLTWTSTNLTSCDTFGDWSGSRPPNGSEVVSVWGWSRGYYELDCTGPYGDDGGAVDVSVVQPLTPRAFADQRQMQFDDYADEQVGIAQTFTVGVTGWLTEIGLNGTGGNSYDRIALTRTTPGGDPDSSATIWSTTVLNQSTAGIVHLAKPLFVVAGQHLAITLTAPNGFGDDYVFGERYCTTDSYRRGDLYLQSELSGPWTKQPGCDAVFETFVIRRAQQH